MVSFAPKTGLRAGFALSVSMLALCSPYSAMAQQSCADGSAGPLCTIVNSGASGAISGTLGTVTVVQNSGTITANPAINQNQSVFLVVGNSETGVITGNIRSAVQGIPKLGFQISNAGTINGDVLFDDQPASSVFTGTIVSYISDGGTLNGNLQLGTTGFNQAYFLHRGANNGVSGTISAGGGFDIFAKSYDQTQSIEIGNYDMPSTFEFEGYEALGDGVTLTLTGTGTTINLSGNGNVINAATISPADSAGAFPPQAVVVPAAINSYQSKVGTFRRFQLPQGAPASLFTVFYGNALNSFTNTGIVNGDIRLGTASFSNTGEIRLNSATIGSVIFGAADRDFLFDNSGMIVMTANGTRTGQAVLESEFESGTQAAIRLRAAYDTTVAKDVRIANSGEIIGGLSAVVAAKSFVFENSGTIEGIESTGYFSRGVALTVGELDLVVGEDATDEFNADSASIINAATGVIRHGFSASLDANVVSIENHGTISASGQEDGIGLYVENDLLEGEDGDDPDAASLTFVNSGTIAGSVVFESEAKANSFTNSGAVTRALQPFNINSPPYFGAEYSAFGIEVETGSDQTISFTNSGTISNLDRASSGLIIEVDAEGDGDVAVSANVHVVNSGTISTSGGATLTPAAVLPGVLEPETFLINPVAALSVDATDTTGASIITIENLEGGTISASGNLNVVVPDGYLDQGDGSNGSFMVAVAAQAKVVNITNSGLIRGGAGNDFSAGEGLKIRFEDLELPDRYLAGAIQTVGDDFDGVTYVGSVDHVVNSATGEIIGSIDLGANDDVIENYGSITGNVFLRGGNDTFTHSLLGTFDGIADGGAGEDTLIFDITGATYTGTIDPVLRAKFVNFEIEKLLGTGTVVTDDTIVVSEGGSLTLDEGSNIDVGAGNTAISGSETASEAVTNNGAVVGNIDMRGGDNVITNLGTVTGDVAAGDGANFLANEGTITGSVVLGDGSNTVENLGTITNGVTLGNGGNSFTNAGTVQGDVAFGGGNDALILTGDWALGGSVDGGAGTDIVQATFAPSPANEADVPILDLSGFQQVEQLNVNGGTGKIGGTATFDDIAVNGGRLIGAQDSIINADIQVNAGAVFGSAGIVNGDLTVASGGTLSPGASPDVMTVSGDVALAGGSTTVFEFVPAPGQSDQFVIQNGSLTIASGAVLTLTGNRPLTPGVAYDMIVIDSESTDDRISGEFTIGTWDRTAVQGFLRYTPTKLQLLGTFVAPQGLSTQTAATVTYVNGLLVSGEAGGALLGAVPSLLGGNGLASAAAFGQLSPEPYATASQLGVEHGLSLAKASRAGATAATGSEAGFYSFAQGLGDWRTLKGNAGRGVSRATSHSYGLLGGLGYGSENGSIGAFVGYIDSSQKISALDARTDADGVVAGISGHFAAGGFDVNALIAYDWSKAETRRAVPGNIDVTSKYDLGSLVLDASMGYSLPVSTGWVVRPELGLTHISTRRDATVERGSAAFALAVERERTKATFVDGALTLRGGQEADATFHPWVQAGIRHQFDGDVSAVRAGFVGTTSRFTVFGAGRKETMVTAGAGFSADLSKGLRLFATYQGEFGGGTGNNVNVGLRFAF